MKKGEKGYTLVEILIVLSLVLIVSSITLISFQPLYRQLQINHFFHQLQLDITYAQMYAMSHSTEVHISFIPQQNKYIVQPSGLKPSLILREYPREMELQLVTLTSTVTFLQNGSIRRAGTMHIKFHDETYVFVFLFGKGQTYVNKL